MTHLQYERREHLLRGAGLVAALTFGVHVFIGGGDALGPMMRASFSEEAKLTMRVVWHLCSAVIGLTAVCLLRVSMSLGSHHRPFLKFIATLYALWAALFVGIGLTQLGASGLVVLPQWTLLAPLACLTWAGAHATREPEGSVLTRLMPRYDYAESHTIEIAASKAVVEQALARLDLGGSRMIRTLFKLRRLPSADLRLAAVITDMRMQSVVTDAEHCHFGVQRLSGSHVAFDEASFVDLREPRCLKLAWGFVITSCGPTSTVVQTETRVLCTDRVTHLVFAAYWIVIRPFSGWIRILLLKLLRRDAEQLAQPAA